MGTETTISDKDFLNRIDLDHVLSDKRSINAKNWNGHEEQINRIFSLYRDKVNPLISVYNSLEDRFPIGVMNELRDVFSHLTQSLLADKEETVNRHFDKAERHLKRAVVDAFKYASMAYSKVYDEFKETYKDVDLSYVDNGELLPKLTKLDSKAEQLMLDAKLIEADIHTDEDMYAAYEKAFNHYADLYKCIMGALNAAETIRMRALEEQALRKKEHRTDRLIGIAGVIVGIAGIVIGFFI